MTRLTGLATALATQAGSVEHWATALLLTNG